MTERSYLKKPTRNRLIPYVVLSASLCFFGTSGCSSVQPTDEEKKEAAIANIETRFNLSRPTAAMLKRAYKGGEVIDEGDVEPMTDAQEIPEDAVPVEALPGVAVRGDVQPGVVILKRHVAQDRHIVYATRDIAAGTILAAPDLDERQLQEVIMPARSCASAAKLIGRRSKTDIGQGCVIMEDNLQ
jgi:hypothetical protein